jgi:hypothetical protein
LVERVPDGRETLRLFAAACSATAPNARVQMSHYDTAAAVDFLTRTKA